MDSSGTEVAPYTDLSERGAYRVKTGRWWRKRTVNGVVHARLNSLWKKDACMLREATASSGVISRNPAPRRDAIFEPDTLEVCTKSHLR